MKEHYSKTDIRYHYYENSKTGILANLVLSVHTTLLSESYAKSTSRYQWGTSICTAPMFI